MAIFELRRSNPDTGELVGTGDAEVDQEYIPVLTPGGALLSGLTWDQLLATHTPPRYWLTWPDGAPLPGP